MVGQYEEKLMFMTRDHSATVSFRNKPHLSITAGDFLPQDQWSYYVELSPPPCLDLCGIYQLLKPGTITFVTIWFNISLQNPCVKDTQFKCPSFSCPCSDLCSFTMAIFHWNGNCCLATHIQDKKFQLSPFLLLLCLKTQTHVLHNHARKSSKMHLPQAKWDVLQRSMCAAPKNTPGAEFPTLPIQVNQKSPSHTHVNCSGFLMLSLLTRPSLRASRYPAEFQSQPDIKYKEPDMH